MISRLRLSLVLAFGLSFSLNSFGCDRNVNRDVIDIVAEAQVRVLQGLAVDKPVSKSARSEQRRKVLERLAGGWEIYVQDAGECSLLVSIDKPDERGAGMSAVVSDGKIVRLLRNR